MKPRTLLATAALLPHLASCSFALDWAECDATRACPDNGTCNLGVCETTTDDTDNPVTDGVVDISGVLSADTTWTPDVTYRLNGVVYVDPGVTLTIQPGTTILGTTGSVLTVERGGVLDARGTPGAPIVFTSAKAPGERRAGDWGGVVLLGDAETTGGTDIPFDAVASGSRGRYGGSEDDSSCGTMQYVRIEFAGISGDAVAEVSALELAGCGTDTVIDYVQIHRALDEGVDILGGSVRLKHVLVTLPGVSGIEWAEGWHGNAQFIAVHLGNVGVLGFEADEFLLTPAQEPDNRPEMFNVTLLGSGTLAGQIGVEFASGTRGHLHNMIIAGMSFHALDVKDEPTVENLEAFLIELAYSVFFQNGIGGTDHFPSIEEETSIEAFDGRDDDGGFDEDNHFRAVMEDNAFDVDPDISNMSSETNCGWVPAATLPDIAINPHAGQGLNEGAKFLGAFQKGVAPWTDGWITSAID